jgi:hypothetical protein
VCVSKLQPHELVKNMIETKNCVKAPVPPSTETATFLTKKKSENVDNRRFNGHRRGFADVLWLKITVKYPAWGLSTFFQFIKYTGSKAGELFGPKKDDKSPIQRRLRASHSLQSILFGKRPSDIHKLIIGNDKTRGRPWLNQEKLILNVRGGGQ